MIKKWFKELKENWRFGVEALAFSLLFIGFIYGMAILGALLS